MLLNRGAEIPDYDGVRTSRYAYVQYGTGERELYDLRHDPDEIHNLAGTRPALERQLGRRISQLRRCGGRGCRQAEDHSVPPPLIPPTPANDWILLAVVLLPCAPSGERAPIV